MGRNALPDENKRKQIAVRLSPRDRERIKRIADENGNSLGAEVEQLALDQLAYLEGTSPETRALLERITARIAELEIAAKGRWHKTLKAWAAVSQMLQMIIDDERPDRLSDDECIREAATREEALRRERRAVVETLDNIGVKVNESPRQSSLSEQYYRNARGNALLALSAGAPVSSRTWERAAVEALPDAHPRKAEAADMFARLCELDMKIDEAAEQLLALARPYFEAEEEGRRIGGKKGPPNALLTQPQDEAGERPSRQEAEA